MCPNSADLHCTKDSGGCFPGGLDGKESACNAGDTASIPGSEDPPGERNGYSLQYSCLENFTDRGAKGPYVRKD